MSFHALALSEPLLTAIDSLGYVEPTPIQALAIPEILAGRDVVAQAQTGTGKTAAFALPILQVWSQTLRSRRAHTLVLAPTRELALQVADSFERYAQDLELQPRIHTLIGGEEIEDQLASLKWGTDIVVATPGRLLDVFYHRALPLERLQFLVLDEADKMLSLGFAEELAMILDIVPAQRQTLLFSATFPEKVQMLTEQVAPEAKTLTVDMETPTLAQVQQRALMVDSHLRGPLLRHLMKDEDWSRTVVFVASKRAAANVTRKLQRDGIAAVAFHGDLTQAQRVEALRSFEKRQVQVLIATDIAARGLDLSEVTHVVNFDLPRSPADYIHRIGRTARAGKSGTAISFVTAEQTSHFSLIEKRAAIQLEREQIPGFEPQDIAVKTKGQAPVKGRRRSKKDKLRAAAADNDGVLQSHSLEPLES